MAVREFEAGRTIRPVILFETGGVRLQEANLGLAVIAEIQAANRRVAPIRPGGRRDRRHGGLLRRHVARGCLVHANSS